MIPKSSKTRKIFSLSLFLIIIVICIGVFISISIYSIKKENEDFEKPLTGFGISDMKKFLIPYDSNPDKYRTTLFKVKSKDKMFFSTLSNPNNGFPEKALQDLYHSEKMDYKKYLQSVYLEEEKNNLLSLNRLVEDEKTLESGFFAKLGSVFYTSTISEYKKLMNHLKSQEDNINKKSFISFILKENELRIFTFNTIEELLKYSDSLPKEDKNLLVLSDPIKILSTLLVRNQIDLTQEKVEPIIISETTEEN